MTAYQRAKNLLANRKAGRKQRVTAIRTYVPPGGWSKKSASPELIRQLQLDTVRIVRLEKAAAIKRIGRELVQWHHAVIEQVASTGLRLAASTDFQIAKIAIKSAGDWGRFPSISLTQQHHTTNSPWGKVPQGLTPSYGIVLFDADGNKILIREVANHFDGYHWSYAKGKPDHAGENPVDVALRELKEGMGVNPADVVIVGYVPKGHYSSPSSVTYFFIGRLKSGSVLGAHDWETAQVQWADRGKAAELLSKSTNSGGKKRDLGILESAARKRDEMMGLPATWKVDEVLLPISAHGSLWATAIEQTFADANAQLTSIVHPAGLGVAESIYKKVGMLFGGTAELTQTQRRFLHARLGNVATQITGINQTTMNRIRKVILNALDAGKTTVEVADYLRRGFPQIAGNRIQTIARTEMGRAADDATKLAMKDSGVVSHFSVIGCQAIEPNSPTWHGIHTCNIQNVPIEAEAEIKFHPNHTGTIVVAGFYDYHGRPAALTTVSGGPDSLFTPAPGLEAWTPTHASSPEMIPLATIATPSGPVVIPPPTATPAPALPVPPAIAPGTPPFLAPVTPAEVEADIQWAEGLGAASLVEAWTLCRNSGVNFTGAVNSQGLTLDDALTLWRAEHGDA